MIQGRYAPLPLARPMDETGETGEAVLRPLYPAGYRPRAGRFTLPVRGSDSDTAVRQVTKATSAVRP